MVFVEYYGEGNPIMSGIGFNHGMYQWSITPTNISKLIIFVRGVTCFKILHFFLSQTARTTPSLPCATTMISWTLHILNTT